MSQPPDRIRLKRRRGQEYVDTLVFEPETQQKDKRRRHTDFYFRRLPANDSSRTSDQHSQPLPSSDPVLPLPLPPPRPHQDAHGIPTVRATAPGEEIIDFAKLRAAQKARVEDSKKPAAPLQKQEFQDDAAKTNSPATTPAARVLSLQNARRFHLTRDLSSPQRPHSSGAIRKRSRKIRPPLPTFVEKLHQHPDLFSELEPRIHNHVPVHSSLADSFRPQAGHETANTLQTEQVPSFQQPQPPPRKTGQSIHDHPSTWDVESDQLADELAALAMEFDPIITNKANVVQEPPSTMPEAHLDSAMDSEEDFVYETYIRISRDDIDADPMLVDSAGDVGILIIDEEVEDLWQDYMNEDDESEWDEEDSNAEENPANDYPEEEIDTDDEYGYDPYKYRNHGSDDELYDEEYDDGHISN